MKTFTEEEVELLNTAVDGMVARKNKTVESVRAEAAAKKAAKEGAGSLEGSL